jgi:iron complex outermembrane receptor protein
MFVTLQQLRRSAMQRLGNRKWSASTTISAIGLIAVMGAANAQAPTSSGPSAGTPLPAVPVEPPALPKQVPPVPQPKAAARPKAAPTSKAKARPNQAPAAPQSQAGVDEPGPQRSPLQALETLPAASAGAAAAKLEVENTTGSALGLTPRETPATVNIVTRQEIEERGARGLVETFRLVPGVVVGNNPGEVTATVTRGFHKANGFSIDGSRVADPVFLGRDYNSFLYDRVEVLKGPSSVVSGTSGLAGSFNIVTKQATTDRTFTEGMVGYGSFDTLDTGVGLNVALSPHAAFRSTLAFSNSSGFVDDTDSYKMGLSTNILLKPSDRLTVTTSIDFYKDDYSTAYYATPLIHRTVARDPTDVMKSSNGLVLDRANRFKNYNFLDGNMNMESLWLRNAVDFRLSDEWSLRNELSYYIADRMWRDADFYTFRASPVPAIARGITLISHDHEFWSERLTLRFDGNVGGMRNRFAAGAEYMETTFGSTRHFGDAPSVDIFSPDRGRYPEGDTSPFYSRTRQKADHVTKAAFAENAINILPHWIVSAGIRYETIDIDRSILNEATGVTSAFGNDLGARTWRIGTTYDLFPGTTLFAQYAEAVTPVSSSLMIASAANVSVKLTTGNSVEAGIKSAMFGGRVTTTASIYQIEQDDILTRDPARPNVVVQGGSQRARGVEVETAVSLTNRWNVSLSGTIIDTEFTDLRDGTGKSLAGNRPVNSVPWAWNALMTYRLDILPATLGAQLTGVGPFYTSNANLYEAKERTLLDAWIAFDLGKGQLRLRGRNLTDEFYAEWADYNETSVYVGAPRSFDVTYSIKW